MGVPERTISKALSTLVASRAEVSIKKSPFFSTPISAKGGTRAGKAGAFLRGDRSRVVQIALVAHEHDDNVFAGTLSQLIQLACQILKGAPLCNVIY